MEIPYSIPRGFELGEAKLRKSIFGLGGGTLRLRNARLVFHGI